VQALAVKRLAVLLSFFRFGKRTDFNPIIERDFGFVTFVVALYLWVSMSSLMSNLPSGRFSAVAC
jgi:hypothetical protein